jgi:sialate O-acetylesterase
MRVSTQALGAVLALALAQAASAAPRLEGVIGDHAVLQRDRPLVVAGTARPGEAVLVNMAGRTARGQADREGRFSLTLPPLPAGGPYQMLVTAPSGQVIVDDLMMGDVFLCSGQSNMELATAQAQNSFQIAGAADQGLRLLTVPKRVATAPQSRFDQPPAWTPATPETIAGFSAVCFYMGQDLRKTAKAPIGLIHASWGGSRISPWMAPEGLRAAGMEAEAKTLELYTRDTAAAEVAAADTWGKWWRDQSGDAPGREPWRTDGALDWRPAPGIGAFNRWGIPELTSYVGMLWFRKDIGLTADQARQGAVLSLGAIDDADRTWVNGVPVGGGSIASAPRRYRLSPGVLVEGRNAVTINVDNVYAEGGMIGPASQMRLRFDDGSEIAIDTGWRYAVAGRPKSNAPRSPWDDINGAGTLYNAMIAPLGLVGLKGVAWYQGESDTDLPGYDRRLRAMMADWRRQFATPHLPFAVIQLSAYGATASHPTESGWARLRDIQRRTTEADGHAAAVVTIDLGDPLDIHPGEKQEVGRRTARAMRALAYGEAIAPSGPGVSSAVRNPDGGVTLAFKGATGGLVTHSANVAIGFELCAETGPCRFAAAVASGDTVVLAGDGKPVTRVRYAWADAPAVNLFDQAGLPVSPFEIAVP